MNRDDPRYAAAVQGLVDALEQGRPVSMPVWGDQYEWSDLVMNLNIQLGSGGEQFENPFTTTPMNTGPDSIAHYYNGYGDVDETTYPVAVGTQLAGGAAVTISSLAGIAPWIIAWIGRMGLPIGTRMAWSRLPWVVRQTLKIVGVTEGVDIIFDTGPDDSGLIPVPDWVPNIGLFNLDELFGGAIDQLLPGTSRLGQGDEVRIGRETYIVASSWDANGVRFYRFRNGMLGVQNKHGVWKAWRPKKPIVIFASGASDLRDLVRADKAVDKQSGKLAKMLRRRGYSVKKS